MIQARAARRHASVRSSWRASSVKVRMGVVCGHGPRRSGRGSRPCRWMRPALAPSTCGGRGVADDTVRSYLWWRCPAGLLSLLGALASRLGAPWARCRGRSPSGSCCRHGVVPGRRRVSARDDAWCSWYDNDRARSSPTPRPNCESDCVKNRLARSL